MMKMKSTKPIVLAYHAFDTDSLDAVRFEEFKRQIALLHKEKYHLVTFDEISRPYRRRRLSSETAVAIAFIGGHESIACASEYLLDKGVPFTLFVPTGQMDHDGFLTWKQLKDFAERGVCIQSNGVNHINLRLKKHQEHMWQFKGRVNVELEMSKQVLESKLGAAVRAFACPFGIADRKSVDWVLKAGYACCLIGPSPHLRLDNLEPLLVYTKVHMDDTLQHFKQRLQGELPVKRVKTEKVSIIIPTYNRKRILEPVVHSTLRQEYPSDKYEVIVVDDGGSDGSDEMVRKMAKSTDVELRYIWQEDLGFRAGTARNYGASEANNKWLLYIDGDIVCHPRLIAEHMRCQQVLGEGLVLGYTCAHSCDATYDVPRVIEGVNTDTINLSTLDILPDFRDFLYRNSPGGINGHELAWLNLWSNNLSLTKKSFEKSGGFDEGFKGWGMEDIEFGYRLQIGGVPFHVNRDAVGFHIGTEGPQLSPFSNPDPKKFEVYANNMRHFYNKHPDDIVKKELVTINSYLPEQFKLFNDEPTDHSIDLGAECNNNCVVCDKFCKKGKERPSTAEVQRMMEVVPNRQSLTLWGGEPTLREDLPELVNYANFLLYRKIIIVTNARTLSYWDYAKKIVELGARHFEIPLYGHTSELHDYISQVEGSFSQMMWGIKHLQRLKATIVMNVVLCKGNRAHKMEILRFAHSLGLNNIKTTVINGED